MVTRVINFGSINIDHIYRVPHFVQPGETLASSSLTTVLGGKGANQSVALSRAGADVTHVGAINENDGWAIEQLADAGVNTGHIRLLDSASGHAIIQVDDHGENSIVLFGGANQCCTLAQLENAIDANPSVEYLLLQNECNMLAQAVELADQRGLKIALNPAPMSSDINALPLEKLHLLIVNQVEGEELSGQTTRAEIINVLQQRAPNAQIVLTLGKEGAVVAHQGELFTQAAMAAEVVDTTAAGDTFVGYYLAGILNGLAIPQCLQQASQAAALAVTKAGAIPSIPTLNDVSAVCTK